MGVSLGRLDYRQRPVNLSALCFNNDLHGFLFRRATAQSSPTLLTFNHPAEVFGQRDVGDISVEGTPVDTLMVQAQKTILQDAGIYVAADELQGLHQSLVSSYLLYSAASLVGYQSQRGPGYMLVTKNADLVRALNLSPSFRKKGTKDFESQFFPSYEELRTGSFRAVALFNDVDGVRLSKVKVSARNAKHLVPFYAAQQYAAQMVKILERYTVLLTFRSGTGTSTQIRTTLVDEVVAKWIGGTPEEARRRRAVDWSDPSSFGFLSVPDLTQRGRFISVPVLGIEKLQPEMRK